MAFFCCYNEDSICMKTIIVIPSRYGSTRLPAKPLKIIAGKSLVQRVYEIALAVKNIDAVYVATDDQRILEHVTDFGGKAIMTPENCINGTERASVLAKELAEQPDIIINLQGDAVLTPPWIIQALVDAMQQDTTLPIATPAVQLTITQYEQLKKSKANGDVGGTTVTFDQQYHALYFSKQIIPYLREVDNPPLIYRHIGLYAYRYEALQQFMALPESPFERVEKIEILRALENDIKVKIVPVDYQGRTHWAVDSPSDITMVESILAQEGELV